ncbi:MAG: hypothetical protein MUE44_28260 [Oscillatoriaceae cyanobacterium Prado104]|jgi:hypothetical protein|nr:hypothetical protein [Oscillatoriaceae cyanobacterium Prado104]
MMQTALEKQLRYQIQCPGLPLAVYREVAAHLRQVEGVETGLIPQQSQQFDYGDSQVGGLWIQYPEGFDLAGRQRVDRILAYYGDRFSPWEPLIS